MNKFIVKDFLRLKAETFTVEGIEFELMSLSSESVKDLKACDSYNEMISFAADYGLACEGKRVIEDAHMSSRLDELWAHDELELDSDPCVQYRVGEKVCSMSGLDDFLQDTLADEKEKEEILAAAEIEKQASDGIIIEGDDLPGDEVTMGQLNNDADAHTVANNLS